MNQSQPNTAADTIFLDANVLIEIILGRDKELVARNFIEEHSDNLFISALVAHLVIHFGQEIVDLPILRKFLSDYAILSLESVDFEWAFTNIRNKDFEDSLQLAVAIRNGCTKFITFDKELTNAYRDLPSMQVQLLK